MKTKLLGLALLLAVASSAGSIAFASDELGLSKELVAHGRPGWGPGYPPPPPYGPHPGPGPGYPPPPPPPYGPHPGPGPGYPPPPPPPPPAPYPPYPPAPPAPPAPPSYGDFLYQNLNQYLVGDNTLPLRQILGIGPQFRGRNVEFVVIRARTDAGQGIASLLVNGFVAGGSQQVGTFSSDYYFYLDRANSVLDVNVQSLQIALRGRFMVEAVGVKLGNGGIYPSPNVQTFSVNRNFQGQNRLYLSNLTNMDQFRGRRIRSITIRASTAMGRGTAEFCGSRACYGAQTVETYLNDSTFFLTGEVVDYTSGSWFFDLRGNFWVESVSIEFDRF